MAGRVVHHRRLDGVGQCVLPLGVHLLGAVAAHAQEIDGLAAGQRAHHHGEVELAPAGVGDVGEVPSLALLVGDAAPVLPAHQRVQLGVLVDGLVDAAQVPRLFEHSEMLMQICVTHLAASCLNPSLSDVSVSFRSPVWHSPDVGASCGCRTETDGFGSKR